MSNSKPNIQESKEAINVFQKPRIDLSKPRWSQETFIGRFKHFLQTTDPRNIFASEKELDAAKQLVQSYKYICSIFLIIFLIQNILAKIQQFFRFYISTMTRLHM